MVFLPSNNMGIIRQVHRHTSPTILLCVFVAAGTYLLSRCLATIGGTHIRIHRLMGWMYEVRLQDRLHAMINIPSFINLLQAFRSWGRGGIYKQIHRQHGDCISLHQFFKVRTVD
jgi:hypothetical protein